MVGMTGETADGEAYEVEVVRGVTFTCYSGLSVVRAAVEDGVITTSPMPDEMDAVTAREWAAVLLDAADEMERQG